MFKTTILIKSDKLEYLYSFFELMMKTNASNK